MTRKESSLKLGHLWQAGLCQTQIKYFDKTSAASNPAAWWGPECIPVPKFFSETFQYQPGFFEGKTPQYSAIEILVFLLGIINYKPF